MVHVLSCIVLDLYLACVQLINFGVMAGFLLLFLGLMLALVLRNKGQMSSSDIPNFVFTTLWLLMAM